MNRINFCAKIPVATCSIIEKRTQTPIRATIYEHDAKDSDDVQYFRNLGKGWKFKKQVVENINMKYDYPYIYPQDRYFSIEDKGGEAIGLMQIHDNSQFIDIEYVEAQKRKKYGLIGTSLLTYAGIETGKKDQRKLIITDALKKAKPFYVEHCGFQEQKDGILEIPQDELTCFIDTGMQKTRMIDLRG